MPLYYYKAKKKDTKTVAGQITAQSKDDAIEKVNQLGLIPITLNDATEIVQTNTRSFSKRVTVKDLYAFTRQLAALLKAGITLVRALQIIERQVSNKYLSQVTSQVSAGIKDGRTLSDCLADFPRVFSSLYVSMVRAGEESGQLQEMLVNIAEYQKSQNEIMSKVRAALAYPLVMLFLGIATIMYMLTAVMPKMLGLFDNIPGGLPAPTQILINISEYLRVGWFAIVILLVAICLLFQRWIKTKSGHYLWSKFLLNVPYLNHLLLKIEIARFSRTLQILLKSGITILKAMRLSTPLVKNSVIRTDLETTHEDLTSGESLGQSLKKSSYIPGIFGDLMAVGEESGSLAESLGDIADTYEQETDEALKIVTTLLEPLMIVLVGAAIGFIVFAILMPVFQMDVFS